MGIFWLVSLSALIQGAMGDEVFDGEYMNRKEQPVMSEAARRAEEESRRLDAEVHERRVSERKLKEEQEVSNRKAKIAGHIRQLEVSGSVGTQGAWLYGDWMGKQVDSVVECARECENAPECFHWNYQVDGTKCDLKRDDGGVNQDNSDWVTGNSSRYKGKKGSSSAGDL